MFVMFNFWGNRSKVNVTRVQCIKKKCDITQHRVVLTISFLETDMRMPPATSGAQNVCHGNVGCLATMQRSMYFMAAYFKKGIRL